MGLYVLGRLRLLPGLPIGPGFRLPIPPGTRLTRPPRWEQMDNRRRVRWAYARLRAQRPDIADAQTAREALSRIPEGARMADVYDAARYGLRDITDEEAAFMRTAVQRRP